jgi:hypothetical protein
MLESHLKEVKMGTLGQTDPKEAFSSEIKAFQLMVSSLNPNNDPNLHKKK